MDNNPIKHSLARRSWHFSLVFLTLLALGTGAAHVHKGGIPPRPGSGHPRFLYVLAGQEVVAYRIGRDGTLTRIPFTSPYLGRIPSFLAESPGRDVLFAGGIDDEYNNPSGYVSRFQVSRNAALSGHYGIPAGTEPLAVTVGYPGRNVYVVSDNYLLSFRASPSGDYAPVMAPIPVGSSSSVAASPDGRLLWVSHQQTRTMTAYRILPTGVLKPVADLRLPGRPGQIVWFPNSRFAYIACPNGLIQEIGVRDGRPVPLGPLKITTGLSESPLAISPDGRRLFICDTAGNRVGATPVTPDGHLGGKVAWRACPYPYAMTLTRDGRFAYTLDPKDNLIGQFSTAGGGLTPLKPLSVPTEHYPVSFAIAEPHTQ